MKIYIAGPITGIQNYQEAFDKAEAILKAKGHIVMNPCVISEGFEHEDYMHVSYAKIDVCDAVYMIPNWEKSKGATMEFAYAGIKEKLIIIAFKN